jgi:hypothetical protein
MVCPSQSRPRARSLMILAPLYPCSCFPFPRIRISPSIYRHSDLAPARAYYSVRISNGGNYRPPQNQKVRHELCCHASQDRRSQVVSRADEVNDFSGVPLQSESRGIWLLPLAFSLYVEKNIHTGLVTGSRPAKVEAQTVDAWPCDCGVTLPVLTF